MLISKTGDCDRFYPLSFLAMTSFLVCKKAYKIIEVHITAELGQDF